MVCALAWMNAKPDSPDWHYLSMLIHFRTIKAALPKGLTATATLSAIEVMGHMWKSLAVPIEVVDSAAAQTAGTKPTARNSGNSGTAVKSNSRGQSQKQIHDSETEPSRKRRFQQTQGCGKTGQA